MISRIISLVHCLVFFMITLADAYNQSPEKHRVTALVDHAETGHIILEVTDDGIPSLTRYQRIIVSILPQ